MNNKDKLIEIATHMAQELQEFVEEAEKAGCKNPLPGTQALIDEFNEEYKKSDNAWQNQLPTNNTQIASL